MIKQGISIKVNVNAAYFISPRKDEHMEKISTIKDSN